jgi:Uma2 family endonuclease
MPVLVLDRDLAEHLKAERHASGADRYDEVWEGVYHVSPLPGDEHQEITTRLSAILTDVVDWPGVGRVRAGVNVSDREDDWTHNYRIPDVAVFLPGNPARNCGTHWCGGPDFAIEIRSPDDETRDKLPFYAKVGVRELLLLDREPWVLELYRAEGGRLNLVGTSTIESPRVLTSSLLPLTSCLRPGGDRPAIEVCHIDGAQRWSV